MRITTTIFAACMCFTIVNALPLDQFRSKALDRLMMSETDNDSGLRSKRTIGLLRQFFPDISKRIEDKVNKIIGELFKIFGPAVIGNLLGGANKNNNAGKSGEGSTVEVKNPFDDDSFTDDDDFFNAPIKENTGNAKMSVDLLKMDINNEVKSTPTSTIDASKITTTDQPEETTVADLESAGPSSMQDVAAEASETNQVVNEADSAQSNQAAESQNNEVRVQFADETPSEAASEGELAPLDDVEVADDDNRNKRFLNFGGSGSGSGAGSGNFLFDIIRQAADGAARAAGTVYRVVAGTQSLGLGLSASRDIGPAPAPMMPAASGGMMPPAMMVPSAPMAPMAPGATKPPGMMMGNGTMPPLVTGGGSSASTSDPAAGAPEPGPQQEAVPGPVTRLFVIANRGISNLIQDLILRLAATSERIVNFKARLITSII